MTPGRTADASPSSPANDSGRERPLHLLFVCVENSNRSQMAEAFARMHGGDRVVAASAGSRPSGVVNPRAVAAMAERGYDLSAHRTIRDEIERRVQALLASLGVSTATTAPATD